MGSGQSATECEDNKNPTPGKKSYVEHLIHVKHTNFLRSNSMDSKEVLRLRKERILKTLKERTPIKPYALQLIEARAAAKKVSSPVSNVLEQEPVREVVQVDGIRQTAKPLDQKSKILQRLAAKRKNQRTVCLPPERFPAVDQKAAAPSELQQFNFQPQSVLSSESDQSQSTTVSVAKLPSITPEPQNTSEKKGKVQSPSPSECKAMVRSAAPSESKDELLTLTSPDSKAGVKAQTVPVKMQPTRLPSQQLPSMRQSIMTEFLLPSPPSAIESRSLLVPPFVGMNATVSKVLSTTQEPKNSSESKARVQSPTPSKSKAVVRFATPSVPNAELLALPPPEAKAGVKPQALPVKMQSSPLPRRPSPSTRQSIMSAFSQPSPPSEVESKWALPPPLPSIGDLLKSIGKPKQDSLFGWMPSSMEEKMRYGLKDPVPSVVYPLHEQLYSHHRCRDFCSHDKPPSVEYDSDGSCGKRNRAEVDRLTDQLMDSWNTRKTSEELLGLEETELSLLTYGEPRRTVVPHRPVRKEKVCGRKKHLSLGYSSAGEMLVPSNCIPTFKCCKSEKSVSFESRWNTRKGQHVMKADLMTVYWLKSTEEDESWSSWLVPCSMAASLKERTLTSFQELMRISFSPSPNVKIL